MARSHHLNSTVIPTHGENICQTHASVSTRWRRDESSRLGGKAASLAGSQKL